MTYIDCVERREKTTGKQITVRISPRRISCYRRDSNRNNAEHSKRLTVISKIFFSNRTILG